MPATNSLEIPRCAASAVTAAVGVAPVAEDAVRVSNPRGVLVALLASAGRPGASDRDGNGGKVILICPVSSINSR